MSADEPVHSSPPPSYRVALGSNVPRHVLKITNMGNESALLKREDIRILKRSGQEFVEWLQSPPQELLAGLDIQRTYHDKDRHAISGLRPISSQQDDASNTESPLTNSWSESVWDSDALASDLAIEIIPRITDAFFARKEVKPGDDTDEKKDPALLHAAAVVQGEDARANAFGAPTREWK